MQISKNATSIVEVLVIMLIVIIGTVGMYTIFGKGQALSNTTSNRIQAIQIAREGLEAMINIRDTNYLLYSSNYKECWNTLNYNSNCISENDSTTYDIGSGSYKIFQDSNAKWYLGKYTGTETSYSGSDYRTNFKVMTDTTTGLYSQSGGTDTKPLFTREIKISYPGGDSNSQEMNITSLVQWSDSSKQGVLKVELNTKIFNFKNK